MTLDWSYCALCLWLACCSLNVTIDEVIAALEFMQANRELVKPVTTTPTPVIEPESNTDDPYDW